MNVINQRMIDGIETKVSLEVEYHVDFCSGGKYCVFKGKTVVNGPFSSLKEAREELTSLIRASDPAAGEPI